MEPFCRLHHHYFLPDTMKKNIPFFWIRTTCNVKVKFHRNRQSYDHQFIPLHLYYLMFFSPEINANNLSSTYRGVGRIFRMVGRIPIKKATFYLTIKELPPPAKKLKLFTNTFFLCRIYWGKRWWNPFVVSYLQYFVIY